MHLQDTTPPTETCLVIGITTSEHSTPYVCPIEQQSTFSALKNTLSEPLDTAWQTHWNATQSLLMIHCGEADVFDRAQLSKVLNTITTQLGRQRITHATYYLPQTHDQTPDEQLTWIMLNIHYAHDQYLTFKQHPQPRTLQTCAIVAPQAHPSTCHDTRIIADAISTTRRLAGLPGNVCTPQYLAEQAIELAETMPTLQTTILEEDDLKTLGMGAFLAVAQGSDQKPKLIEMHYQGVTADEPPIILVGKGITFDSGGLSLKPANGMEEMKYDMAGAASVFGVLKACAYLKLPVNVIGLMACAENMPGGGAIKPGDIVTTFSGQTVEIINTDAEGRLVLADTLTYAAQFHPKYVIDIATLTGAAIIALGHEHAALMSLDDELSKQLENAAQRSGDTLWRLPLSKAYHQALESSWADMVNSRFDRQAGSIVAGCFLSKFVNYPWAHLDIAGTAWVPGSKNHPTGRPVPLLIQWLRDVAYSS